MIKTIGPKPSRPLTVRELKACAAGQLTRRPDWIDHLAAQAIAWNMATDVEPRRLAENCYRIAYELCFHREQLENERLSVIAVRHVDGRPTADFAAFERHKSLDVRANFLLAAAELAAGLPGRVEICSIEDSEDVAVTQDDATWHFTYADGFP